MNEAAQQLPVVSIERLVAESSRLYSLPDVYLKVKSIIDDPDSEIGELGQALMTDPSLSARLLRIANSAFYGLSNKVDTISRAVQVIGFKQINNLVVATSITHAFEGLSSDKVNIDKFWMASVERALVARVIAEWKRFSEPERLFVGGLLLDIGHLVMYEHIPGFVEQVIERAEVENKSLSEIEIDVLGFSAAELGASLAKHWQLPEALCDQILCQDQPELAENKVEAAIMYVAKQLAGTVPEPEAVEMVFDAIPGDVKETLGLSSQNCEQFLADALCELSETLELVIP